MQSGGPAPERQYRSAGARANCVLVTLGVFGIVMLLSMSFVVVEIDLLMRIEAGAFVSQDSLEASDRRQLLTTVLWILALIATATAFCFWIHRAAANLGPLGASDQRFSPGWAVGWWFVPIAMLILPYRAMKEIWKGSYPRSAWQNTSSWRDAPASPLLGWWWVAWLSGNVTSAVAVGLLDDGETIGEFIRADWVFVAGDALLLMSGMLAFVLVWQITSNQEEKNLAGRCLESGQPL